MWLWSAKIWFHCQLSNKTIRFAHIVFSQCIEISRWIFWFYILLSKWLKLIWTVRICLLVLRKFSTKLILLSTRLFRFCVLRKCTYQKYNCNDNLETNTWNLIIRSVKFLQVLLELCLTYNRRNELAHTQFLLVLFTWRYLTWRMREMTFWMVTNLAPHTEITISIICPITVSLLNNRRTRFFDGNFFVMAKSTSSFV